MSVSPPRPKGPHLNALRAFEAAARLRSFSAAAEELSVTPGAIAQHIKALEAWAGASLFRRHSRGVDLTSLGASVLPAFIESFDRLGDAVHRLRSQAMPDQVRIVTLPSIAQLWLSPRLPDLRARHPDVTISVTAQELPPNLKRDQFDIAVFMEEGATPNDGTVVCRDVIFPVCAPALAEQLFGPADLAQAVLLHDARWIDDWERWLTAAGQEPPTDRAGPVFSLYGLALDEAIHGAGVLIGHEPLVRRHLDSGALVAPFDRQVPLDRSLVIRASRQSATRPLVHQIIAMLSA